MSRLRLAVVGVGHLGKIHARLAAGLAEIDLRAIVDGQREACQAVAVETGARPLSDFRELFGEVDAAVVATPTATHCRVASELMRGGIHVLVEKPLAPTVDEADELVQIARKHQLVLQVGHVERFNPAFVAAQPQLADARYIEARRCSGFTFRSTDVGVVMDLMIHDIDAALSLIPAEVVRIDAVGTAVLGEHEDLASARLEFANGAVANLTASRVSYAPQRTMQVFTPRRFAAIDFAAKRVTLIEPSEQVVQRTLRLDAIDAQRRDRLKETLFEELLLKRELPVVDSNALAEELRDFAAAIVQGRRPQVTGVDGRNAVAIAARVIEAVRRSQQHGESPRRSEDRAPSIPLPAAAFKADRFSTDDTVILRRKTG